MLVLPPQALAPICQAGTHTDGRIEHGGRLKGWQLPSNPGLTAGEALLSPFFDDSVYSALADLEVEPPPPDSIYEGDDVEPAA
jgi:hypothetical protein